MKTNRDLEIEQFAENKMISPSKDLQHAPYLVTVEEKKRMKRPRDHRANQPQLKRRVQNKKFKELMKPNMWQDSLAEIDASLSRLKTVRSEASKMELARQGFGSHVGMKRKVTLTNFDEFVNL